MDRIAVIGCGGSGKTYLANQLGTLLDLPVIHLDGHYYDTNWNPRPAEEFAAVQRELVGARKWIIEWNHAGTLPIRLERADTVVFLDLPAVICLTGIAQRRWHYRGGQHVGVGVYDRITWSFVRYICRYRANMRPRVRQLITDHARRARVVRLTDRRQARRFLDQFRSGARAHP